MKHFSILTVILLFGLITRLYNLNNPPSYYFDEVYHAVTAKAYALNNPAGYEWWHSAPEPGTAYEWLHPPVAKLFMALGWKNLGQTAWAWRFPGAVTGVLVIAAMYWVTRMFVKNKEVALLAAGLAAFEGLLLSMSRIGMNDIYVTLFMVLAVGTYWRSRTTEKKSIIWLLASGVLTGLAVSTKWSGVFILPMVATWELLLAWQERANWFRRLPLLLISYVLLPIGLYLGSYGQFWLQGHTWDQFRELHNQIWWYQTHLEATHDYQSKAWEWPLMIRPVWFWVRYFDSGEVANIYNLGNPFIFWFGLSAVGWLLWRLLTKRTNHTLTAVLITAYAWSWMPWLLSPRIMFFYHYTPAVPWLIISLAIFLYTLVTDRSLRLVGFTMIGLIVLSYVWLSPLWFGIPVPTDRLPTLFWLPSWK